MVPDQLSLRTKIAYGIGEIAGSATNNIRVFFLLFFLTSVAGLDAGLAGTIMLIGRIWDAINDPLVGWLSDRTRSPLGKRHPWMLWGAIPFGLLFLLLWVVPQVSSDSNSQQTFLFWYYIIVALLFDTVYTAVVVPYAAMAPELTSGYNERTSLISIQMAFSVGAGIFALVLAQVIFELIPNANTQHFVLGAGCAILSVIAIYACVWGTRRSLTTRSELSSTESAVIPLWSQIRAVLSNRAFQLVTGMYVCSWVSVQVAAAVLPYYVVNWMGLPKTHFTQMAIAVQGTTLVTMLVWSFLGKRLGKKAIYFLGMPPLIVSQIGFFFLRPDQVGWMYACGVGIGIGLATVYLVPRSMLPDVIDLDELHSGQRREGLFCGFMVQMQKIGLAIALFLVGQGLHVAGFISSSATEVVPTQPDSALLAIRLAIGPIPTLTLFMGLALAYFYPISRDVHENILLQLKERRQS